MFNIRLSIAQLSFKMQKISSLISSTILAFSISSCTFNKISDPLRLWQGKYFYEEKPIKAVAGYYMVMEWELDIRKEGEKYVANVEVNGQQTYIKLLADIAGDEKTITLL